VKNLENKVEALVKSVSDLRAQMRRNAEKKKRQKAEFDKEAQRKADIIKEGGNLRSKPDDSFKPNAKMKQPSAPKADKKPANKPKLTVVKAELIKALAANNMHDSAILLKNWNEMDKNAELMQDYLSKGGDMEKFDLLGSLREAVGRPAAGGLVEGAAPDGTAPRDKLSQSEDDKMGCCGMPKKTCKCDA
jgi:hypothetical protein